MITLRTSIPSRAAKPRPFFRLRDAMRAAATKLIIADYGLFGGYSHETLCCHDG